MTSAGFHNPVQVITGDFVELIGDIASPNEPSHKLLVASDRFSKTDDCSRLMMRLGDECSIFTAIENDPSVESCQSAIDLAIHSRPDLIIAIGGGSVIDTAKAMRLALYKDESEIRDLLTDMAPGSSARKPDFLAVPTTHGTGSEVTMWATIWDKIEKRKYSISDPDNYPDYAIYDATLCETLPLDFSIISGLDALSHAFEAIWNKNRNDKSDELAIQGIGLLVPALVKLTEPVSLDLRKKLLLGSQLAGQAFSNTRTAAAHSISYPLTAHFGIPHGVACSMPLRPLLKINEAKIRPQVDQILELLSASSVEEIWTSLAQCFLGKVGFCLRDYGVNRSDLSWVKDECFTKGRMENNIVDLNIDDVGSILDAMF